MDAASTHVALRITARVSLLLFLWAFAASALARLLPNRTTQWLESNRPSAVLAFAVSHTVHLGLILTLAAQMGAAQFIHTFTWVTVIVGGMGFALDLRTGLDGSARDERACGAAAVHRFRLLLSLVHLRSGLCGCGVQGAIPYSVWSWCRGRAGVATSRSLAATEGQHHIG